MYKGEYEIGTYSDNVEKEVAGTAAGGATTV